MSFAKTTLGKKRQSQNIGAPHAAKLLQRLGCPMTARRLYRIESGLAVPSKQEKQAISALYGCTTWEVGR